MKKHRNKNKYFKICKVHGIALLKLFLVLEHRGSLFANSISFEAFHEKLMAQLYE